MVGQLVTSQCYNQSQVKERKGMRAGMGLKLKGPLSPHGRPTSD